MKRLAVMPLILLLGLTSACSVGRTAANTQCYADTVQTSPGLVMDLGSGQTYHVYPTDNHISMNWLPLDRLTVCPIGGSAVELTNISQKNQKVRAVRIFNPGWYVWPAS
jgi:hypothetical protein